MSQSTGAAGSSNYTAAQNLNDRATLLGTAVPMIANLGTFGPYQPGQVANIRLRNVGIMTRLKVRATASVTIATANVTASPFGPYGLVSKVDLLDYNTTERVIAPGPMLYFLNSMRHGRPWMPTGQGNIDTLQTQLPTVVGAGQTIEFNFDVPLAYDPSNDLTGAILAQTIVGEQFLRLTVNPNAIGDPFCPYLNTGGAGTAAISNVNFQVWQEYLQPQGPNIPRIDLNTVYEFTAMFTSSDNIVVGGTKFIDYPNVRNVKGAYFTYINDNAGTGHPTVTVNGTDINSVTLIANGNTNMRELDPLMLRRDMRIMLGGDLPAAMYYMGHRRHPIYTWIYSQVQLALNFANATANPYVAYGFESTYPLNTPLPGVGAA